MTPGLARPSGPSCPAYAPPVPTERLDCGAEVVVQVVAVMAVVGVAVVVGMAVKIPVLVLLVLRLESPVKEIGGREQRARQGRRLEAAPRKQQERRRCRR